MQCPYKMLPVLCCHDYKKASAGILLLVCTVEERGQPPILGARELEGGLEPPQSSAPPGIKAQKIGHHPVTFERADLVRAHQAHVPEDAVPWRCTALWRCRHCTLGVLLRGDEGRKGVAAGHCATLTSEHKLHF